MPRMFTLTYFRGALPFLMTALLAMSCGSESATCTKLFGQPSSSTGLGADQCGPQCDCGGSPWAPHVFTTAELDALSARVLTNPPELLSSTPYEEPEPSVDPDQVCGVVPEAADGYRLETFSQASAAEAAGATITHLGPCGLCSSLQDLLVYVRMPDLTEPVRSCGLAGLSDGEEANRQCLAEIGFSDACAQIWYYNTVNTRELCLLECLAALEEPNHLEDGSLNPCIQCDEDKSGPIFKAIAGRTRRGSGLASALCRPCESVGRVDHDYSF